MSAAPGLADQPWLSDPATVRVMEALEAAGGPDCARFVGGCVRNSLVGQAVDDIDIATRLQPEQTMAALKAAGIKAVPTGLAHGTVTAVADRRPFEITTLRRDVETDGRRAVVAFTDDWGEDAQRRDFRLNALYADRTGAVFDPTGGGLEDALAGRVVFVGDPHRRIEEDHLRILRFFRFLAWYGRAEPDAEGLAACAAHADSLSRLSAERVSKELLKLLAAPDPRASVSAMFQSGVLETILPGSPSLDLFTALIDETADAVLRLASLLPFDPAQAAEIARSLRLPNDVQARLAASALGPLDPATDEATVRRLVYRLGARAVTDRLILGQAENPDAEGEALTEAVTWPVPRMPIGGREVARLGIAPGPETGRILKAFEDEWVAADFPDHGHEERLRRLAASGP